MIRIWNLYCSHQTVRKAQEVMRQDKCQLWQAQKNSGAITNLDQPDLSLSRGFYISGPSSRQWAWPLLYLQERAGQIVSGLPQLTLTTFSMRLWLWASSRLRGANWFTCCFPRRALERPNSSNTAHSSFPQGSPSSLGQDVDGVNRKMVENSNTE